MIKPTHFIPCRGGVEIGQHHVPRRVMASSVVLHPDNVEFCIEVHNCICIESYFIVETPLNSQLK